MQKITVKHSKGFSDLLEYELEQLKDNENVIYEREFLPSWVKRACLNCSLTYLEKEGEIYECKECGLIKVPKGVDYNE